MTVEQKVIEVLKNNTNVGEISEGNFGKVKFSQLGINSLNFIKIIVELEDEFNIEFDDNQLNYELFNSIDDLIKLIKALVEK